MSASLRKTGLGDGLRQAGWIDNELDLGENAPQIAQQLWAIIADEEGRDAAHALGDYNGPKNGVAVAVAQGFAFGGIEGLRNHSRASLYLAQNIGLRARSDTPALAFKSAFQSDSSRCRQFLLDLAAGYGLRGAWLSNSALSNDADPSPESAERWGRGTGRGEGGGPDRTPPYR